MIARRLITVIVLLPLCLLVTFAETSSKSEIYLWPKAGNCAYVFAGRERTIEDLKVLLKIITDIKNGPVVPVCVHPDIAMKDVLLFTQFLYRGGLTNFVIQMNDQPGNFRPNGFRFAPIPSTNGIKTSPQEPRD